MGHNEGEGETEQANDHDDYSAEQQHFATDLINLFRQVNERWDAVRMIGQNEPATPK
jgi:hypothetical protein